MWKGDGDPSAEENGARGGRASGTAVRKSDVGCVCVSVCVCVHLCMCVCSSSSAIVLNTNTHFFHH